MLQLLLAERISIRDLPTILEGIADALAFMIDKRTKLALATEAKHATTAAAKTEAADEPISTALKIDDLKIELGYAQAWCASRSDRRAHPRPSRAP